MRFSCGKAVLTASFAAVPAALAAQDFEGPYATRAGVYVLTTLERPTVRDVAHVWAPILWFADDEPLFETVGFTLPAAIPGDPNPPQTPQGVVHYRATVVTEKGGPGFMASWDLRVSGASPNVYDASADELILPAIDLIRLQYLFYFPEDNGGGGHLHDLEIAEFWLRVAPVVGGVHLLRLERVIGYAHGHKGLANKLRLKPGRRLNPMAPVSLPITLLIERGKHAPASDRRADGDFTPGFDVNEMVGDAWGIRDVFGSEWLGNRAYDSWMTLRRRDGRMAYLASSSSPTGYGSAGSWTYWLRDFREATANAGSGDPELFVYLDYHEYGEPPHNGPDRFLGLADYIGVGARLDMDRGAGAYASVMMDDLPMIGGHPVLSGFFGATWSGNHRWFGASALYSPSIAGFFNIYGGVTWVQCPRCSSRHELGPEGGLKFRIPIPHAPAPDFVGLRVGLRYRRFKHMSDPRILFELGLATP